MNQTVSFLPDKFLEEMKELLGTDYEDFLESFQNPRTFGLRLNSSKISNENFVNTVPFSVTEIPWIPNGYFYEESSRPSKCPYYQAGLYYLQEPSAMTPASLLDVLPGDYVLDLCAAPGGKATALGSKLKGKGILVANDISTSRARALLRNIELFGISNAVVTNEQPVRLAQAFPGFFNKILLDAPCSGEGMFRKEEALARDWSPEKSRNLSDIQKDLILLCWQMLRPGGFLLYSTCTFSSCENESVIAYLLHSHPEAELLCLPDYEGFSKGIPPQDDPMDILTRCVRIFPHKMHGEGHFMALIRKPGDSLSDTECTPCTIRENDRKWIQDFLTEVGLNSLGGIPFDWSRVEIRKEKVFYLPPVSLNLRGISYLRNGLYLGDLKKNRFEPSQPLALAIHRQEIQSVISLPVSDERLTKYLRGEPVPIAPDEAVREKGWHLLCVDGYPLGFGKLVNQTLKNKYPAGWRI